MEETKREEDLRQLRERQAYIAKQEQHLRDMRSHQDAWILFARGSGSTFEQIAQALGVSSQAAQKRFHRIMAAQEAAGPAAAPE